MQPLISNRPESENFTIGFVQINSTAVYQKKIHMLFILSSFLNTNYFAHCFDYFLTFTHILSGRILVVEILVVNFIMLCMLLHRILFWLHSLMCNGDSQKNKCTLFLTYPGHRFVKKESLVPFLSNKKNFDLSTTCTNH